MAHLRHEERDSLVEAALDAMDAEELRELVRAFIPWLDDAARARLMSQVIDGAARGSNRWVPSAPSDRRVEEIEAFVAAARIVNQANPGDVDDYLRAGTQAFLARDYAAAVRIFRSLLIPIGSGDIDVGQHETIDEVLGEDVYVCSQQFVVAVYMTASSTSRARAVCSAIEETEGVGYFAEPLRELEQAAVEPLPDFDDFLIQWRAFVEQRVAAAADSDRERREDRWLREVVARTQGPDGLAAVARRSRRYDDLRAWGCALVEAGDWIAARAAYQEAAALVEDDVYCRGVFLDGAALAARELGLDELDAALERAWRQAPTLGRLCRWLGRCSTRAALMERAGAAMEVVPAGADRQRALLYILRAQLGEAATLLADAPGLGWSFAEHPGYLVFPLFVGLLGGEEIAIELPLSHEDVGRLRIDDRPQLPTPTIEALLELADLKLPEDEVTLCLSMLMALRTAAEKRVEGVTANKRRRCYRHAAFLAVESAQIDGSPVGEIWLRALMDKYRRYPALMRAFKAAGA